MLLFFAVVVQRELLGVPTFASFAAQTLFCWEPDDPGDQRSCKHQSGMEKLPENLKRRNLVAK